jgi:hypothetical protein
VGKNAPGAKEAAQLAHDISTEPTAAASAERFSGVFGALLAWMLGGVTSWLSEDEDALVASASGSIGDQG